VAPTIQDVMIQFVHIRIVKSLKARSILLNNFTIINIIGNSVT